VSILTAYKGLCRSACGNSAARAVLALALAPALLTGTAEAQDNSARKPKPKASRTIERKEILPAPKGPLHIIVSLADQRVALYGNGALVAQAPISSGTASNPTPTGVFSVIQKNRHHRSNLYNDAPMPFMQRITWSGVALHQGALPGYPASHGCIRLPAEFARQLFGFTRLGARVIVTRNGVAPMEIAHPRLFTPIAEEIPVALRGSIGDLVRTASVAVSISDASVVHEPVNDTMVHTEIPAIDTGVTGEIATINEPVRVREASLMARETERRSGPVSVFVSRKEGRLYVRQNFQPLFDVDVTIDNPEQPLGTHVFTAMAADDGRPRWTVVSVPSRQPRAIERAGKNRAEIRQAAAPAPSATEALERVGIPTLIGNRIAEMVAPGFSFIISDQGLGHETGLGTDFIVLTR
jgi:hypothetical protein